MENEAYVKAFLAAVKEAEELQAKRADIEARLARLNEIVQSFARLVRPDVVRAIYAETGLTDSIAKVLRNSRKPLAPAEVRDELVRMRFDTKRYKSIIPSIVKVLERLVAKNHVYIKEPKEKGEKKLYSWNPMQPMALDFDFSEMEIAKKVVEAVEKDRKGAT